MSGETMVEISYDPYAPEMREDPWETFKLLRDHAHRPVDGTAGRERNDDLDGTRRKRLRAGFRRCQEQQCKCRRCDDNP